MPSRSERFPTTHWTRLLQAAEPDSDESRGALASLCANYWYPIYALIRREGNGPDEALDLTQDYFARLIEKGVLSKVKAHKGRFRAFLRTDCGFFLADQRDYRTALKRGGRRLISMSLDDAEGRYRSEPRDPNAMSPDRLFDHAWAVDLLDRSMDRVAREYAESGRASLFEAIRGSLAGHADQTRAAAATGLTIVAVESAVRRLRKRLSIVVRELIAQTLDEPTLEQVEDEVKALFAALC